MASLEAVLEAPKAKRQPTDPNVKILKRLARNGWNVTNRGAKTMMVREQNGKLFITNTYAMRTFPIDGDVADAVRSVIPDCHDVSSVMADGFELGLTAGHGGSWLANGRQGPDMAAVWPTTIAEHEIVSWESNVDDPDTVFGHTVDGVSVLLNVKFLKGVTDGIDGFRVFAVIGDDGMIRKPVQFVADGSVFGILMPIRQPNR